MLAAVLASVPVSLAADTILLSFQSVPGGLPVTGAGTSIGIVDYGTVSAFEPLGSGMTRAVTASDYTISTQLGVRVTRVLGTSGSYTLQVRTTAATPVTWLFDGVPLSTTPRVAATAQTYGPVLSHALAFRVPLTLAAAGTTAIVEVTAIAN